MDFEDFKEYEAEVNKWAKIQNEFVSLFVFTFAMACFSMSGIKAVIASAASLTMFALMLNRLMVHMPKALDPIMKKKNKSEKEVEHYNFSQEFINKHSKYWPFTFSYCCLCLVAIYNFYTYFYYKP